MPALLQFETERLILRPTTVEDAPFVFELVNSPKWLANIGDRKVYSIEDAVGYIEERILPQQERLGFSNYTVIRKADGTKLGSCGLYDREGLEGVDIGFAFLPQYEGQGYAWESASKIKEAAIQHFGIHKISAITIEKNIASQKLIKKLGLTFTKKMRLPDDPEELWLYEWTADLD